jgi:type VI secretion system protein VasD
MFVIHSKRRVLACAVVLSVCLTGCGLSQKVIEGSKSMAAALFYKQINILHLDFISRGALNTDAQDTPLSTMVHIWQLKSRARFDKADYDTLLTQEEATLNGDVLAEHSVWIKPEGAVSLDVPLDKETQFVAIAGQFYQPDEKHNTWRLILTRDDLDADKPRTIELLRSQLTLLRAATVRTLASDTNGYRCGELRNVALSERLTPQGTDINVTPINALTTTPIAPENVVQLAVQPERQAAAHPRRSWPVFFAGMMTAACLSGIGIGGWIFLNQPDLREQERSAMPISELSHYAQAQKQLQRLSQQLDTLDERKGKYLTASELKTAVFAIRQSLQTPPLEELLRQLDEQTRAGEVTPALIVQIETRFQQLLNRYAILSNSRENHSGQKKQ